MLEILQEPHQSRTHLEVVVEKQAQSKKKKKIYS